MLQSDPRLFLLLPQISRTAQDFAALQQKLNEIMQAHQSNPEHHGMFVRGKNPINGYVPQHHHHNMAGEVVVLEEVNG